jgi:hypothetical protein
MDGPMWPEIEPAWRDYLANDRNLPGGYVYGDIFDHPWIFPLQRRGEMAAMMELAEQIQPRVVCEIGSDKGGGFYHWVQRRTVHKAIALEIRGVPFAEPMRQHFPHIQFCCEAASSYAPETVEKVKRFLDDEPVDCLFLDGDKGAFDKDWAAYAPLVRKGGLVFIHDVQDEIAPRKFFHSLKDRYRLTTLRDCREGAEAMKRKAAGIQSTSAHDGWLYHWGVTSCGVGVIHL